MKKAIVKYGILSALGIFLILQFLPIGDYCSGLGNFISSFFLIGILILIVIILAIRNLIQLKKSKDRFDFIPLILVLFFGVIWYTLMDMPDLRKKFWTNHILIGIVEENDTPKSGTLVLFQNGTFEAKYHRADYSCTYQGDYEILNNRLNLKRTELTILTDSIFTTGYSLDRRDGILIPEEKGFYSIRIVKMDN